jgi:hypothetical protein
MDLRVVVSTITSSTTLPSMFSSSLPPGRIVAVLALGCGRVGVGVAVAVAVAVAVGMVEVILAVRPGVRRHRERRHLVWYLGMLEWMVFYGDTGDCVELQAEWME